MVKVQGVINPYTSNDVGIQGGLGGNALATAVAIDYDSWKIYGFNSSAVDITVPFFTNPETQCAPYAVALLNEAKRKNVTLSAQIIGNEYQQPGEVVYLEQRNLLFYVTSVSHSYRSGSGFTTSINGEFGHPPGEYIPNPIDIVGKLLYNNRDTQNYIVYRHGNTFSESNLGCIVLDPRLSSSTKSMDEKVIGSSQDSFNYKIITDIIQRAAFAINASQSVKSTTSAKVELRIYYSSNDLVGADKELISAAEVVKNLLEGKVTEGIQTSDLASLAQNTLGASNTSKSSVEIITIDLSASNYNSPSQKAMDAVRDLSDSNPTISNSLFSNSDSLFSNTTRYKYFLYKCIIDCYLKLDASPTKTNNTSSI
jgi:hypothetical protein